MARRACYSGERGREGGIEGGGLFVRCAVLCCAVREIVRKTANTAAAAASVVFTYHL